MSYRWNETRRRLVVGLRSGYAVQRRTRYAWVVGNRRVIRFAACRRIVEFCNCPKGRLIGPVISGTDVLPCAHIICLRFALLPALARAALLEADCELAESVVAA